MSVLRALAVLVITGASSLGATFGTVVAHPQPLADLVLDEARKRIYVVNTAANQVEVYTTANPPRQTNVIHTEATPLAIAIARNGKSLYVTCYDASSINIIDLTSATFSARSVTLPAKPEGIAVGFDERLLISTIGTATGQSTLLTFDPTASTSAALGAVIITPGAPTAPTLPPPSNKMALASHSRLQAKRQWRTDFTTMAAGSLLLARWLQPVSTCHSPASRHTSDTFSPALVLVPRNFATGPD